MSEKKLEEEVALVGDNMTELLKLRIVTERSGILHDAQVLQLKYWPYVLFDIKEHSIIPDDRKRTLCFNLVFSKGVPKDVKNRAEVLQGWVWSILGKQFAIKLRNGRNNKVLFDGERGDPEWKPSKAAHDEVKGYDEDDAFFEGPEDE